MVGARFCFYTSRTKRKKSELKGIDEEDTDSVEREELGMTPGSCPEKMEE